ncbi:MAG: hypothetical protein DCF12_10995 [Snowella sp.]|nr:MAG: hypothetical protein DCF12_10995 [Snowella sp.]
MGNHSLVSLGTILTGYTNIFCSKFYLIAKHNRIAEQSKQHQVRSPQLSICKRVCGIAITYVFLVMAIKDRIC